MSCAGAGEHTLEHRTLKQKVGGCACGWPDTPCAHRYYQRDLSGCRIRQHTGPGTGIRHLCLALGVDIDLHALLLGPSLSFSFLDLTRCTGPALLTAPHPNATTELTLPA